MNITIDFHGPFRVSTGVPREGMDVPVDPEALLPASSLKGVMRAAAQQLLPGRSDLVEEVFGRRADTTHQLPATRPHGASPWHWNGTQFPDGANIRPRAHVSIDPATGTARSDHLRLGEEVWARQAQFQITQRAPLSAETLRRHQVILACSASAVHALGGDRRRGQGWVTLTPQDPGIDDTVLDELWSLHA